MRGSLQRAGFPPVSVIVPSPPNHRFYYYVDEPDDYHVDEFKLAGVQDGTAFYGYVRTTAV